VDRKQESKRKQNEYSHISWYTDVCLDLYFEGIRFECRLGDHYTRTFVLFCDSRQPSSECRGGTQPPSKFLPDHRS
jgi:hypothetical protein